MEDVKIVKTYKTDKIGEEENELDDICTAAHLEASTGFTKQEGSQW